MAEHKHGEMDIKVQEAAFEGLIKSMTRVAVVSIALLIFIAIVNG